jgi:hypothetical protein
VRLALYNTENEKEKEQKGSQLRELFFEPIFATKQRLIVPDFPIKEQNVTVSLSKTKCEVCC